MSTSDPAEAKSALNRFLPITDWLPRYEKGWIRPDLLAGLTVWALLVPEAMAYADLAGMPAETGLYAGLGAIIGYALFGTSRQLFVGPSSTVAILSFSTVAAVATSDNFQELTIALALMVGVIFVVFGALRLGLISVFLSKPVLVGFTFGLGLTIAIGQADKVLGIEGGSGNFFEKLKSLLEQLPDADQQTTAIGLGALAILLVSRKLLGHKVPMALIVVFVSIILSNALDWAEEGVHVVGEIPASLPSLNAPRVGLTDLRDLLPGALGIVLVGFAESYGAAQNFSRKHDDPIDANQELIGLGAANLGAGLFGGFTVDGSLSRSSAADEAGGRSQMAMLICGVITLVTIGFFTPVFEQLPEAVLGAIVISAVWGTFNVAEMRRIWHTNRADFIAASAALLGVCVVDILEGLLIAVLVSFVLLIYRASRPSMPELERIPGGPYVDKEEWQTEPTPGVLIVRIDAPVFFANAEALTTRVAELLSEQNEISTIVLDLETANYIDTDGSDQIRVIYEKLAEREITLLIARLRSSGRAALQRAGLVEEIGLDNFFPSVRSAVRRATGEAPDETDRLIEQYQLPDDDDPESTDSRRPR